MDTPTPKKRLDPWPAIAPDTPISKRELHIEMERIAQLVGDIISPEEVAAASKYSAAILNSRDDRIKEQALEIYIDRNCDWGKTWAEIMMYRSIGKSSAFFIPSRDLDTAHVEELGHAVGFWVALAGRGILANLAQQLDIQGATLAEQLRGFMMDHKLRGGIQEWTKENLNVMRWEIYQLLHEGEEDHRTGHKTATLNGLLIHGLTDNEDQGPVQQLTPETPQFAKFQNAFAIQKRSNKEYEDLRFQQALKEKEEALAQQISSENPLTGDDEELRLQATRKSTRLQSTKPVNYRLWANGTRGQNASPVSTPLIDDSTNPRTPNAPRRVRQVANEEVAEGHFGSPPSAPKRDKVRKTRGIAKKESAIKQRDDKYGLERLLNSLEDKGKVLASVIAEKEEAYAIAEHAADAARADFRMRNSDMMMTLRAVTKVQDESTSQELQAIAIQHFLTIQDEADSPLQMALDEENEARVELKKAEQEYVTFTKKYDEFRLMAIDSVRE